MAGRKQKNLTWEILDSDGSWVSSEEEYAQRVAERRRVRIANGEDPDRAGLSQADVDRITAQQQQSAKEARSAGQKRRQEEERKRREKNAARRDKRASDKEWEAKVAQLTQRIDTNPKTPTQSIIALAKRLGKPPEEVNHLYHHTMMKYGRYVGTLRPDLLAHELYGTGGIQRKDLDELLKRATKGERSVRQMVISHFARRLLGVQNMGEFNQLVRGFS